VIGDGAGINTLASTIDAAVAVGFAVEGTASIAPDPQTRHLAKKGNRRTEHALLLRAP